MSELATFRYDNAPIRTVTVDGEPWFVAADVARTLGYRMASDMTRRLDSEDRGTRSVRTPSGQQDMTVISEAGLYAAILGSQIPGAREFKRWVTHEVLPALRQHGRYEVAPLDELEVARRYVLALEAKNAAEAKVAELAPKAEAHDAFESADGTYSFEQVAKMLHAETGLGRNNLIKRLRAVAVLTDKNLPYQRYAQHFHVVASSFEHTDGRREMSYTTRVRSTGVDFIRRKLGAAQGVLVPVP